MPHDVLFGKAADGNIRDIPQDLAGLHQSGAPGIGQIDLGHVPGDNGLGVETQPGQKHLHLFRGGVLRLIQNDKAVVQRASPHIGQRRHLYIAPLLVLLEIFRPQHIKQGVVQRPQVRVHLVLQVAGEEAQLFAGFHGGTGQHDAVDLLRPEGFDGHGHRQIGLAGAGRSYPHDDGVFADGLDILLLANGFGLQRFALGGNADDVPPQRIRLLLAALLHQTHHIADILRRKLLAGLHHFQQALDAAGAGHHLFGVAAYLDIGAAEHHRNAVSLLQHSDVLVRVTKQGQSVLHPFKIDALFGHGFPPSAACRKAYRPVRSPMLVY